MPSLSIVIPTKNEEKYLPELLESIQKQTLLPDLIIVADAGSIDQTVQIAKEHGCRVVEGGLPGPGRNAGAKAADTDIVLFLDADVVLKKKTLLEDAVQEFEEKKYDIATADVKPLEGGSYDEFAHDMYNKYVRLWGDKHAHAPGFFLMVRKSLHDRIGGFDETVVFCEDHDYACRGNREGEFGFLDSVTVTVSTRRLDRDGRLNIAVKYILGELHILAIGPIRHHAFNYTFGYKKD